MSTLQEFAFVVLIIVIGFGALALPALISKPDRGLKLQDLKVWIMLVDWGKRGAETTIIRNYWTGEARKLDISGWFKPVPVEIEHRNEILFTAGAHMLPMRTMYQNAPNISQDWDRATEAIREFQRAYREYETRAILRGHKEESHDDQEE